MVLMTQLQVGAMFGGVSQVMNQLVPDVPVNSWVFIFLGITLALLLGEAMNALKVWQWSKLAYSRCSRCFQLCC